MSTFPRQASEWAPLILYLPSRYAETIGVLLVDTLGGLHVRLRSDWCCIAADDEYVAVCSELEEDLTVRGRDIGGTAVLDWLEESASHTLRIGERHPIEVENVGPTLEELFNRLVTRAETQNHKKNQHQERHRVHVAIAAAVVVIAVLAATRTHVTDSYRPISTLSTSYVSDTARVLLDCLPQRSATLFNLKSVPLFSPAAHHHFRTRIKTKRVHRRFWIAATLRFQPPVINAIQIDAPPLYNLAELNPTSALDVSLPEPPPFQARNNRFVHFLCVVASPFKKLFSSRNFTESLLN